MTPRKKIGCYCIEVCKRDDPANNGLRCIGLPTELPGEKSNQDGRQAPAPSGNAGLGTAGGAASSLHQSLEK